MTSATGEPIDFAALMKAHLASVFNERDPTRRMAALKDLYTEEATLFEPGTVVTGHAAISGAIDALQASLPPEFVFTALGPAVGHHGVARLRWSAGPPGGPAAVTGMDVAQFEDRRIKSLHVFLDPKPG
jgi:hypothetical protein